MSLTTADVTYDVSALFGTDYSTRGLSGWVTTNIRNDTLIDVDAGLIRVGNDSLTIGSDGTGTVALWTPSADANPTTWQYYFHFAYYELGGDGERKTRTFGPYTITEDANLAVLEEEQAIPPEYLTSVTEALDAKVTAAEEAAAAAAASAAAAGEISELRVFVGPVDPSSSLPPGTEYVWNKTDGAGVLLDIITGVAA